MQLEYRILWFDDQPQGIKPFVDRVSATVTRLGFEPKVDLRIVTAEVADPLANLPAQAEVDLVMMDWKLGGGHDGADLARKLRQTFRDTDIVFYSSTPAATLREEIYKQGIDGVFCCIREHLSDRAGGIIHGQLRRTLDLNHMRGIVMAATSDLDQAIITCLEVVQQVTFPGDPDTFGNQVAVQVAESLRKKADEVAEMGHKGKLAKLLREPAFGSFLRLQVLQHEVAKLSDRLTEPHRATHLDTYHKDVITPRNDFAHRKAEVREGKLHLEGREQPLDHDSMKALRLRLLEHADNLRGLLSLFKEMASAAGEGKLADEIAVVEAAVADATEAAEAGANLPDPTTPS